VKNMKSILVVNLRGCVNVPHWAKTTFSLFNLRTRFRATILPDNPVIRGMLPKIKDYAAWSTPNPDLILKILEKRGKSIGNKPITPELLAKIGFKDLSELANALCDGKIQINQLPRIKPSFALNSPRGGFRKSSKRHYNQKGILGENPELHKLVESMI